MWSNSAVPGGGSPLRVKVRLKVCAGESVLSSGMVVGTLPTSAPPANAAVLSYCQFAPTAGQPERAAGSIARQMRHDVGVCLDFNAVLHDAAAGAGLEIAGDRDIAVCGVAGGSAGRGSAQPQPRRRPAPRLPRPRSPKSCCPAGCLPCGYSQGNVNLRRVS